MGEGHSLLLFNLSHPGVHTFDFWLENTVTAVIISRRPNNIIGWLLNVSGFFLGLNHLSSETGLVHDMGRF
jgi:hypothetical protein